MRQYAIYLRKSRADIDAEARGEGETLAKHRTALYALAKQRGLPVAREYAELVTGDSIAARPQMQLLLDDVKKGLYKGVIVNDVDRLGRGDSIDQEIIKYAFIAGHCIIITPNRDIDPASPSDEDMLDFSMFFARFEYRKIAQRLMQGKARSAAAGNWILGQPVFGYKCIKDGRNTTLIPDEQTAPIVKMIFEMYASGEAGYALIATRLSDMGIRTKNGYKFTGIAVRRILHNSLYIGRLTWGRTSTISVIEDGQRTKKHINANPTIVENAFPAIIDMDLWERVQARAEQSSFRSPVNTREELRNPLAGLIVCSECGHRMWLMSSKRRPVLVCMHHGCKTSGTYVDIVETALLEILAEWKTTYVEPSEQPTQNTGLLDSLRSQLNQTVQQLEKIQEFVEIGVYTPSEYIARRDSLLARKAALESEIGTLSAPSQSDVNAVLLPKIEYVLQAYQYAQTVQQKNDLLRSVIDHVVYYKTHQARKNENPATFLRLEMFPKIIF